MTNCSALTIMDMSKWDKVPSKIKITGGKTQFCEVIKSFHENLSRYVNFRTSRNPISRSRFYFLTFKQNQQGIIWPIALAHATIVTFTACSPDKIWTLLAPFLAITLCWWWTVSRHHCSFMLHILSGLFSSLLVVLSKKASNFLEQSSTIGSLSFWARAGFCYVLLFFLIISDGASWMICTIPFLLTCSLG